MNDDTDYLQLNKDVKKIFEDWFWELEGFHFRAERFWDDYESNRRTEILDWLKTAFALGYTTGSSIYGGTDD